MIKSDAKMMTSGDETRRLSRRTLFRSAAGIAASAYIGSAAVSAQSGPTLAPAGLTAQSVYSFDSNSNVLLYSQNPDERFAIGSLVKIATALVVVENVTDFNEQVLIDDSDTVDITLESNMQLIAGDTLSVSLLLYGLLIPSGNDAAKALARHVGGKLSGASEPEAARSAFHDRMNAFAAEQGFENTHFENASGMDARDTFSSAREVALLFSLLMQNERLRDIVAQPAYQGTSTGTEKRLYGDETTNERLGQSGVIGGKTGTTEEAGACVAFAREMPEGNIVITAMLGSDAEYDANNKLITERWIDVDKLLADMDETFTWVAPPDDATMPGLEGEMNVWQVETKEQPRVPLRAGDDNFLYQLVLGAPVSAGEQAGKVDLFYGEVQLGSFPVYQAG
jgi:D-alanyl-D-alanine carboxypeptidase (penicillin-binding protein 5/6)